MELDLHSIMDWRQKGDVFHQPIVLTKYTDSKCVCVSERERERESESERKNYSFCYVL
jgi:hypothetical protein